MIEIMGKPTVLVTSQQQPNSTSLKLKDILTQDDVPPLSTESHYIQHLVCLARSLCIVIHDHGYN